MSDGITVDSSELYQLSQDLGAVPARSKTNIEKALKVTATGIKNDWRQGAGVGRGSYTTKYPSSIFYDILDGPDGMSAEIGPELGRPGGTAGFLEEAPGGVRAKPQHAGRDALEANEDDFIRGLLIAVTDPLEG